MKPKRPFDIILFDLEGTLVDFQWQLDAAEKEILQVLEEAGIDPSIFGESKSYAALYNKTRELAEFWKPDDTVRVFERLSVIYDKYDRDALRRWVPYKDSPGVLEELLKLGYRLGVVSNCGKDAVKNILEQHNLNICFELILSRNDVHFLKPHPEGLLLAMKRMNASSDRALFVGDSLNDILAADRISMSSCFLSGGESRVTGEVAEIATFHVASLSALLEILD